jgi:hypothetical protein
MRAGEQQARGVRACARAGVGCWRRGAAAGFASGASFVIESLVGIAANECRSIVRRQASLGLLDLGRSIAAA